MTHVNESTGQVYDMDACLTEKEKFLDEWAYAQREADEAKAVHEHQTTGQVYDMDACLDEAENCLNKWATKQLEALEAARIQKSQTAAEIAREADRIGIGKAKEVVTGSEGWLARQEAADVTDVEARYRHHMYNLWMDRFGAARSEYSAQKKVV